MPDTTTFVEPEERKTFNPLDEPVNEKEYAKIHATIDSKLKDKPIPEPSFNPPPANNTEMPKQDKKPQEAFNPEMAELPKKDKEAAADHAATMIMDGYEWVHDIANKGLLFNERKLRKLEMKGEIDLNTPIPYSATEYMTAGEFIGEYNRQQENALTVTPEFKSKVMPVLQRVLQKRGIGMTDEQLLIYLFGKDIAVKTVQFATIKSTMKEVIQVIKEHTAAVKESGYKPPMQHAAPTQPEQPVYQQPAYQEPEEREPASQEEAQVEFEESLKVNNIVEAMTNPEGVGKEKKPAKRIGRPKGSKTHGRK